VAGALRLKLTLVNPETTTAELDRLIELIVAAGAAEDEGAP
jgi:L-2,4-diaminobutyrate decarboxylase